MNEKKNLTIKEIFSLALQNHQKNNIKEAEKRINLCLKIDENNFLENKNLENLYLNLDTLITEISSEREKNAILKYDAKKFNEKINELNNFHGDIFIH